ncbi:hypothetical protein Desaf_0063 [Desulfocurvibacter africanus subsp. africanus str. Walvis Bay]|uniref:Uncharacterized protein n=1 Tax=Desulfocurvibacter africanus subsp. africanus str. Walvis Bay TaxID=690850 RepID=F3YTP5_DESAF|nr:hypothetical protein Desaf_0063 [Desulfocurvibacter africanus subsp. africanus str. Walvis Bay]
MNLSARVSGRVSLFGHRRLRLRLQRCSRVCGGGLNSLLVMTRVGNGNPASKRSLPAREAIPRVGLLEAVMNRR